MPCLPEMLFGDNVLRIQHADGYGIEFNAIDALKRVNNMDDAVKVACAQEWQESRQARKTQFLPTMPFQKEQRAHFVRSVEKYLVWKSTNMHELFVLKTIQLM